MLMTIVYLIIFTLLSAGSTILFKVGFENLGVFQYNVPYIIKWILDPVILVSLVTAFLSKVITYFMFESLTATEVFLLTVLSMPIAVIMICLIFGDKMSLVQIIGAILIFIGAGLIAYGKA